MPVPLGQYVAKLKFVVSDGITRNIYAPGISDTAKQLSTQGVRLADRAIKQDLLTNVGIIIGVDELHHYITGVWTVREVNLFNTPGGAVIHGPLPQWASRDASVEWDQSATLSQSVVVSSIAVGPNPDLTWFWELETIGLGGETLTPNERQAQELVAESITKTGNQYSVGLPFRSHLHPPPNFAVAKGQLDSLFCNKLQKNEELKMQYENIIMKYKAANFIEQVPVKPTQGHFLPHHLVAKQSETTPLRIVYNASSKIATMQSLNDCLLSGPSLTTLLFDKLVDFRSNHFVVTADISKAFHR